MLHIASSLLSESRRNGIRASERFVKKGEGSTQMSGAEGGSAGKHRTIGC